MGGLILYPTDTIWGVGCDATNAEAVQKIITLKQRPEYKSFVVLVASEKEILKHVAAVDLAIFEYLQNILKPTTVIYENALGLAENVVAPDGSAAIRICKDEFCANLLKRFKKPLVSTSANISHAPAPQAFQEIEEGIKYGVDYIVHHRQNDAMIAAASQIIRWQKGAPVIIRP